MTFLLKPIKNLSNHDITSSPAILCWQHHTLQANAGGNGSVPLPWITRERVCTYVPRALRSRSMIPGWILFWHTWFSLWVWRSLKRTVFVLGSILIWQEMKTWRLIGQDISPGIKERMCVEDNLSSLTRCLRWNLVMFLHDLTLFAGRSQRFRWVDNQDIINIAEWVTCLSWKKKKR